MSRPPCGRTACPARTASPISAVDRPNDAAGRAAAGPLLRRIAGAAARAAAGAAGAAGAPAGPPAPAALHVATRLIARESVALPRR